MKFKNFVSAHVHIHSFDSASTPQAFVDRELELETNYITVSDHGSLAACRTVYELAKSNHLKPILALEAYFRDDSCPILKEAGIPRNEKNTYADYQKYYHLTLHFQDQEAYETGVKLLSLADHRAEKHGSERKPLFDWCDLEELGSKNVTMTSSCLIGMVNRHLVQGENPEIALKYFDKLRSINKPGNFYVELFPHVCDKVWKNGVSITDDCGKSEIYWNSKKFITNVGEISAEDLVKEFAKKSNNHTHILAIKERHKFVDISPKEIKAAEKIEDFLGNSCSVYAPNGDVQLGANKFVLELAQKYKLPILIGDDAHFATPHEKVIQDIRLMTQSNNGWKFYGSYHRKSSQEAYEYFSQQMGFNECQFETLVDSTHEWASRFDSFSFKNEISLPTKFYLKEKENSLEYMMSLIKNHGRFKENNSVYKKRLLDEIKLLSYNGVQDLLSYFFTPEEICRVYNKNGLLTGAGRGCFVSDTKILMQNGETKQIDQIVVGDLVYSHDKKLHPVEVVWKYYVQEPIYELVFANGCIIKCTTEHQFYTTRGWVAAKHLVSLKENKLAYSIVLPAFGEGVFYIYEKTLLKGFCGWVYDLQIKDTRSYNVSGIAVHNSSAGLLLNYCLGITHVDPIRYDLSMERFLTKDRILSGKLPDIDLDLQTREFLTEPLFDGTSWLEKRFGDHYAQISTEIALKLRSSVKDVARVKYGKVSKEIEDLTKQFEIAPMGINDLDFINGYKGADGEWVQGSKERDIALKTYIKKYPEDWELVQKLVGLGRQTSRHASAFVFANKPIHEFIPMTSVGDTKVTQYTANSVELSGGLKNDLLVLTSLVDINDALKLLQSSLPFLPEELTIDGLKVPKVRLLYHQNKFFDIWDLPADQAVFSMIAQGDTETVFQFCTSGATKWLKYFNQTKEDGKKLIDSIESMAIFTALDRPGPLDAYVEDEMGNKHNMLVEYTRRAMGQSPIGEIPIFSKIIPETYGIPIMQESVQKIYYLLTDCTKAEAEEFRSDIAKKKKSKIDKAYPIFMKKVSEKVGEEQAQRAWNNLETFSQYGFCKAHAVSYAIVAYACAFLKYHYPLQWWCAVLKNATKEEIAEKFWKHCKLYIDLPDIQSSEINFEIKNNRIQAPLSLLDRVGETAHKNLIENKPYSSLHDFCEKIIIKKLSRSLTTRVVHNLIIVGALDSLFPHQDIPLSIYEKLKIYEDTMQSFTKSKTKDLALYSQLNALNIYQLKKLILPIYSENIIDIICLLQLHSLHIFVNEKNELCFEGKRPKRGITSRGTWEKEIIRFLPISDFELFEKRELIIAPYQYPIKIGLIGYVQSYRLFRYPKPTYDKEAIELLIDIEGTQKKFLKWGGLNQEMKEDLTGAVVALILNKTSEEREFNLVDLIIIEKPFVLGSEK